MTSRRCNHEGFSLIEVLLALSILTMAIVPVLYIASSAQVLARTQAEATDLQQRARVAADKLQRDLTMAGAPPLHVATPGALVHYLPPIVPARLGARRADPELSAFADRLTIIYVPDGGWQAPLVASMASPGAGIPVNSPAPGCPPGGLCGFIEGTRALVLDRSAAGAGHDVFTVTGIAGELAHDPPNPPFSRAYDAAGGLVVPIVQRVYYFDRPNRRLMLYDGHQSDVPLVDNVVDVRFSYFGDASPGPGLRPIDLADFTNGPVLGVSPNRFDADLQSIRIVRVTIRLQATADQVRGTGPWFATPGRSASGLSYVPDLEMTFDVAPRNMRSPEPPWPP
jgi:prepilin-type N-terminal cleavage/methylation domain-containing protein